MAEKVVSPGVFTNEIDASFLPAAVGEIGAAIVGPTVKGPSMIPTTVDSYNEYKEKFGETFVSGGTVYQYYTSYAAKEYLRHGSRLTICRVTDSSTGNDSNGAAVSSLVSTSTASLNWVGGATHAAVTLETHDHGFVTDAVRNGGSIDSIKYEVSTTSSREAGTFNLLVRRGDDNDKNKIILETWNNLSMQPTASNFVSRVIGDRKWVFDSTGPFLQTSGSFPNKSKFIRVKSVHSSSNQVPNVGSGSGHGHFGGGSDGYNWRENPYSGSTGESLKFTQGTDITDQYAQGLNMVSASQDYKDAISLLCNPDQYDLNLLLTPGVVYNTGYTNQNAIINHAIEKVEKRADCFYIFDSSLADGTIATQTSNADNFDTSYAATYYPWVRVADGATGGMVWVPPSVAMAGVYAFNDKVSHPWFAPAGLNRGGIDSAIQAYRKLNHSNRDTLYENKVNPIATFPGQGVCAWGQKTLQSKSSALDRINVRRLLIKVKKFIASSSKFLVFENNTTALRKRFLNMVTPYLEQVQSQSGLTAFKVVMDESNNTPDTIDRNILYGQLFLQPTRTAEFIILDFTVQSTGATFPE